MGARSGFQWGKTNWKGLVGIFGAVIVELGLGTIYSLGNKNSYLWSKICPDVLRNVSTLLGNMSPYLTSYLRFRSPSSSITYTVGVYRWLVYEVWWLLAVVLSADVSVDWDDGGVHNSTGRRHWRLPVQIFQLPLSHLRRVPHSLVKSKTELGFFSRF